MALAADLSETHRQLQLSVRAAAVRDVATIWPAFDITNPATWRAVEDALLAVIRDRGNTSAGLALRYYQEARALEQISGSPTVVIADPVNEAQARTSLRVTGIGATGRLARARRPDAAATGLVLVSGSVSRLVLNQGRNSILNSVRADPQAIGWARVTSGHPCAFCAMLASRGYVFKDAGRADFPAHDHCSCSLKPAYFADAPLPGRASEFRSIYDRAAHGLSGADARNAFRRAFSAR